MRDYELLYIKKKPRFYSKVRFLIDREKVASIIVCDLISSLAF